MINIERKLRPGPNVAKQFKTLVGDGVAKPLDASLK